MRYAAFGNEVIDAAFAVLVARVPVLHGGVLDFSIVMHDDLHDSGVQLILVTPRCGTTLQIREVGTLVGNEQRALKLTRVLRIDAEVCGKFHRAAYAFGDIYE